MSVARASSDSSALSGIKGFYASLGGSMIACEGAFFSDQPPDLYCDRFRGNTQEVGVHVSGGKTHLGISGGAVEPGSNTGPELSAGTVWNAAPFTCEVSATGTTCFDTKTGSGFTMSDNSLKAISHTASTASTSCGQKVTVIGARGSGDTQSGEAKTDKYGDEVHGMGNPAAAFAVDLANRLPKGVVSFDPIIYPAAGLLGDLRRVGTWGKFINALGAGAHVGFLGAYTASVNDGKKALEQTVSDEERICPKIKLVLVGYSQGAQVVGDVYQRNLTSQQRSRIVGVVLFGDPYFNPNDNTADDGSFDPTRHGVLGTRGTYPANANGRVFSICHVHDPICQGPGRIDFNQHGNYQSDSWVGTAAAKIASALAPAKEAGYSGSCGTSQSGWLLGPEDANYETKYEVNGPFHITIPGQEVTRLASKAPIQEFHSHIPVTAIPCVVAEGIAQGGSHAWLSWSGNNGSAEAVEGTSGGEFDIGKVACTSAKTDRTPPVTETCTLQYAGRRTVASFTISANPHYSGG